MAARAAAAVLTSALLSFASGLALWNFWDSDSASIGVLALLALVPLAVCLALVRPIAWLWGSLTAAWVVNAVMLFLVLLESAMNGT